MRAALLAALVLVIAFTLAASAVPIVASHASKVSHASKSHASMATAKGPGDKKKTKAPKVPNSKNSKNKSKSKSSKSNDNSVPKIPGVEMCMVGKDTTQQGVCKTSCNTSYENHLTKAQCNNGVCCRQVVPKPGITTSVRGRKP